MEDEQKIVDPLSIFEYAVEQFKNGELTLEEVNEIGRNMPVGYNFEFVKE